MKEFIRHTKYVYLLLGVLAIALYANTLGHGFVLDDEAVIVKNHYVQQGFSGLKDILTKDSYAGFEPIAGQKSILEGGRYRPLSLILFAILYSIADGDSFLYHLTIVFLYALTGFILYRTLRYVLHEVKNYEIIAFITTILVLVHPIHTEVVANIKSMDEVLSLLFGLVFLKSLFLFYDQRKWLYGLMAAFSLFLACLSKESAVVFVLIGPLALWYFRKGTTKAILVKSLPALLAVIGYALIRQQVLGEQMAGTIMHDPMNNPFLQWNGQAWIHSSEAIKIATMIFVFVKYVWLMIFPYPLTHDYYPRHIPLQTFSSPIVWIGLMILLAMIVYGLRSLIKKNHVGFGILFFLIALLPVSNLFFPIGAFMAERFLYVPSVGILLAFSTALVRLLPAGKQNWLLLISAFLVILFSIVTISRNKAWKSNETLALTDIKHAPNSAKLQNSAGTIFLNKALQEKDPVEQKRLLEEAFPHLQKSVELHPTYFDAQLALGACAYYLQQFDVSVSAYRNAAEQTGQNQQAMTGLRYALEANGRDRLSKGDTLSAIQTLQEAWNITPDTATAMLLANIYKARQQPDSSNLWSARAMNPSK